jgi:DNA-binding response OmpR family regulator
MRALVIEDERQLAKFIRRGLEQEGYVVDEAHDGATALRRAKASSFDVIVLDRLLPDLDGLEVCRRLRALGDDTPVIMLTARDALTDIVNGLDSGADDYITKPFEFTELFARMRSVLRRQGADRSSRLSVADLVLDPAAHTVERAGQSIRLTAKEFALLECLMRNAGRALSRAVILESVWGYDHDPSSNVVDVYIRYLRKKIELDPDRPLLHTIVGVGYKLGDPL